MRAGKSDERALWRETMRGVKRLRGEPAEENATPKAAAPRKTAAAHAVAAKTLPAASPVTKPIAALDRRSAQALKRGTVAIEARLDLHGLTQSEAQDALTRFLARAQKHGQRSVLVITGRSGVLHGAVPRWLNEATHRGALLGMARAHTQHGGEGALYLRLRRKQ